MKNKVIMTADRPINKKVLIMAEHSIYFETNYYEDLISPFKKGIISFKIDDVLYCNGHVMDDFAYKNEICAYLTPVEFYPSNEEARGKIQPRFENFSEYKDPFGKVIYNNYSGVLVSAENVNEKKYYSIPIANEILTGNATLLLRDEKGTLREFGVKILDEECGSVKNIFFFISPKDSCWKDLVNGFVPGISGSPIIQNGKLVGTIYGSKKDVNRGIARVTWNTSCIQDKLYS